MLKNLKCPKCGGRCIPMIFFPRDLCEKLQVMGCKSESEFYWCYLEDEKTDGRWVLSPICESAYYYSKERIPAFSQNDFTGCDEQARENARIVWGNNIIHPTSTCDECGTKYNQKFNWQIHRHRMIDAPDAAKYLEETMR